MNEFVGKWRITHMEVWSKDMVDLVEEGYFNFAEDDQGQFTFCAVEAEGRLICTPVSLTNDVVTIKNINIMNTTSNMGVMLISASSS